MIQIIEDISKLIVKKKKMKIHRGTRRSITNGS